MTVRAEAEPWSGRPCVAGAEAVGGCGRGREGSCWVVHEGAATYREAAREEGR